MSLVALPPRATHPPTWVTRDAVLIADAVWGPERRSAARDVRRWETWSLSVPFVRRRSVCACLPACASSRVSRPLASPGGVSGTREHGPRRPARNSCSWPARGVAHCALRPIRDFSFGGFAMPGPSPYILPATPEAYLFDLAACGEKLMQSSRLRAQSASRHELAPAINPLMNGDGCEHGPEMLLCQTAARHPELMDRFQSMLLCPYFRYSRLVASACDVQKNGETNAKHDGGLHKHVEIQRAGSRQKYEALGAAIRSSAAWKASRPHVHVGAGNMEVIAYRFHGSILGWPVPDFVLHANPSHWDLGGHTHAVIPYMPVPDLMSLSAKAQADDTRGSSRTLLLYFRGRLDNRLDNGTQFKGLKQSSVDTALPTVREQLSTALETARVKRLFPNVVFEGHTASSSQLPYATSMLHSVFCLIPSGHTCTTRRYYDAIAAGCLPILVDCEWHPAPFDEGSKGLNRTQLYEGLDYRKFVAYMPVSTIEKAPLAFLHCLRRLSRNEKGWLLRWRSALNEAREMLSYGWWERPPVSNASLAATMRSGEWQMARPGVRLLENLLLSSTMPSSARLRPMNPWQPLFNSVWKPNGHRLRDGKMRAFDLRLHCVTELSATKVA